VGTHNETLSVAAMRVNNEDCLPVGIHGRDAAPTPTGYIQITFFPGFNLAREPKSQGSKETGMQGCH
jgi:hypothetical protein